MTATDSGGLSASQSFAVTVPNRAPEPVGSMPDGTVEVGETVTHALATYFRDPDGDALVYSAIPADSAVAGVSVSGGTVSVAALAKGRATVTVTATDTEGLTATQAFMVTVPNRAPQVVEGIADREVKVGSEVVVDVSRHIADPDGDPLTFAVVSSSAAVAVAAVSGDRLTVTAIAKGTAIVEVTATDAEGLTSSLSFSVTVPNRAPLASEALPDIELEVGELASVDPASHFTDPDGDALTFVAQSSDESLVAAGVAGDQVTVNGVAKGTATVTITATDPEGSAVAQSFWVTVPNRAPLASEALPDIELEVGELARVDPAPNFTDPDGDVLTFSAESSDESLVAAGVAGDQVTVSGVAKGTATVTITATDPEGSAVAQSFWVMVPNRGPLASEALPDIEIEVGELVRVDPAPHFTDPDGDVLTFSAESSDESLVAAVVAGDQVTVSGVAKGRATVTITATDLEGSAVAQSFWVMVPNRGPLASEALPDIEIEVGELARVDPASHFTDPDGDALAFSAESSDESLVAAVVTGGQITVSGVAKGIATVTIAATDPEGSAVAQSFRVTVPNRGPRVAVALPDIELAVGNDWSAGLSSHFTDPDEDPLFFAAESSDTGVATARVEDDGLKIGATGVGTATVTVTASDSAGLEVAQTFQVLVPKRGPVVKAVIPGQRVQVGELALVYLPDHFEHPDGDTLTFSVESTVPAVASADVAGNDLRIRAISRGISRVTVWATDSGGLAAGISFDVLVPNRPPVVRVRFGDRRLEAGEQVTLSLDNRFSDPDGDALTFATESSSPSVATATVVGDDVRVAAVAAGRATVTVTAYDPAGASAAQSFTVTVVETPANHNPQTVGTIPDADLGVGDQITIDVSGYFTDPDEDDLTFDASSSDASVAAVAISGDAVYVTGDAEGTATITVTATDPDGLSASQRFTVTVSDDSGNRAPRPNGTIPDQTLIDGDHLVFDVSGFFADPDGDDLYFSAASSNTSVTTASTSGVEAEIAAISPGTAGITITATDPSGLTATQSFGATVQERIVDNGLDITLHYHDDVASAYRPTIDAAMSLIKSVLADNEFWNFTVDSTYTCLEASFHLGTVDDVAIFVRSMAIDGSRGVLAQASVCLARQDTYYPIIGGVQFDRVDIQELHARGQLFDVAVHEFLHVMGIGVNFHALGLAAGDTDRHFTGSRAIAAFDAAGGEDYQGRKVPTDQHWSHWRESVLDAELMTPGIESSGEMPFSAITIQALADMGYVVDLSLADDYELPSAGPQPDFEDPGGVLDLSDDVYRGPIMIIDRLGNIVRVIPGR